LGNARIQNVKDVLHVSTRYMIVLFGYSHLVIGLAMLWALLRIARTLCSPIPNPNPSALAWPGPVKRSPFASALPSWTVVWPFGNCNIDYHRYYCNPYWARTNAGA
jgi:hypothetical protein